nr:universal stress protein [Thermoanaerobaculia bacterium]
RLSEALTSRLEDQGRRLGIGAADGETRLILDTAERALTTCAADTRAALIVVGESTRARALRLLGTTADRLVRRSPCPVLVTHPGSAFPPRTVLIPVDLSDLSGGALRAGLSMIRQAGWTPEWVEVLFALDPAERTGSLQFSPEQVERFAADELERFLANYGDAAGVNLRRHVLTAEPREGLLERIAELGPDLVVVGTHGRRGLDRLLLGSVATAVLAHAETNVLVVPPEAASAHLASSQEGPDWQYVSDENHSTAA